MSKFQLTEIQFSVTDCTEVNFMLTLYIYFKNFLLPYLNSACKNLILKYKNKIRKNKNIKCKNVYKDRKKSFQTYDVYIFFLRILQKSYSMSSSKYIKPKT